LFGLIELDYAAFKIRIFLGLNSWSTSYPCLRFSIINGLFTFAAFVRETAGDSHRGGHLTVLALATLGDVSKNRNNPIFCRAAQEQLLVAVAGIIAQDFANVNTALRWVKF
jgi:hypothetical protein